MALSDIIAAAEAKIKAFVKWLLLKLSNVVDWFRGRQQLKQSDKDNIAFSIKQAMANGDFIVIQGICNTRTSEIPDGVKNIAEEIDGELENVHAGKTLAIYN